MYSFPNLEPVCCSMSSSNCCFLTCIQISQKTGKVVWYSSLEEFSPFVVIHIDKGFGIVSEAEVDVLWNSLAFLMIQQMLAIWSLVPLPFLNPAWTSGSSWFTYCWSLPWRILSITLLTCELSVIAVFWTFFGIAFLWDWNENWPFPVLWPLLSLFCWRIECSTFTASSFRIWNSSAIIPSPPLTLFAVMLPKAHVASHSRLSGSRWMITPSWLSGSWKSFLYGSVYSCHLFLISVNCSSSASLDLPQTSPWIVH